MQQAYSTHTQKNTGKIYQQRNICLSATPIKYTYRGKVYTIVYQGRLDNHNELAEKVLAQHIKLTTDTDAELIVKLFALNGTKIFCKLYGNFAFAIYESTTQRLYLVRDQLGIKPLFYSYQNGSLAFASQIKSLFAHPSIIPCVNLDGLRELFGVCPARTPGKTVYKNINEIKPGEYACWQKGKLTTKT